MRTLATCGLAMTLASPSYAANVDWQMYGSNSEGKSLCFYDASGLARTPNGDIRVWVKCLPRKKLDVLADKMVLDHAAQKAVLGYVPPIAIAGHMDNDQITAIRLYEQMADLRNIEPDTRMFLELNCSERQLRTLSAYVRAGDGRSGFKDKPSEWQYVPPETGAATLLKILCSAR